MPATPKSLRQQVVNLHAAEPAPALRRNLLLFTSPHLAEHDIGAKLVECGEGGRRTPIAHPEGIPESFALKPDTPLWLKEFIIGFSVPPLPNKRRESGSNGQITRSGWPPDLNGVRSPNT